LVLGENMKERSFGAMVKGWLLDHLGWKVFTGFLAILAWVWIQGGRVVPASAWVNVEYVLPEGLVLTQRPTQRIRVTVSGTQNLTRDLRRGDLSVSVDLADLGPGVQTVDFVDATITGLDPALSIVALKPNSLQVELEPQAERLVRLQASVVGQAAEGFRLAEVIMEPSEVSVIGPASVVEKLDKVMTRALVIDGLSQDTEREISLDLPPPLSLKVPGTVRASLRIQAVNSTRTFTKVPVVCRDPGWRPVQETVSVVLEGPVRALSALEVDALTVMVVLPGDLDRAPLSVGVAQAPEPRLEIVHPGGDTLQLATLEPAKVDVEPIDQ
jgi:hypothetical protein